MLGSLLDLPSGTAVQWERTVLLLGPLLLAGALVLWLRPTPREASAAMLAFLWQLPSLLALNALAGAAVWWSFPHSDIAVLGLPVDVWIGWALWWGPCAALLEKRFGIVLTLVLAIAIDLVAMPWLELVGLSPGWHLGEAVFVLAGLLPGLLLARWTRLDRRPLSRTLIHAAGWGSYMLFALPAVALTCEGRDLITAAHVPAGMLGLIGAAALGLALLVGLTAAVEFARVGQGTPVPVDPPKRVVMTGPYAFVANPMQLTSAIVMALQALHYQSPGLVLVTAAFLLFDGVYAAHYNKVHIARAMPREWSSYKESVADWRPRWSPYRPGRPIVIATTASEAAQTIGLGFALDGGIRVRLRRAQGFSRLVFSCAETGVREKGVAALSRILERRNLGWAIIGWCLRVPLVTAVLQGLTGLRIALHRMLLLGSLAPSRGPSQAPAVQGSAAAS